MQNLLRISPEALVKARGRWRRNVAAARNGVRPRSWQRAELRIAGAKREESLRNSAVWFCGLSEHPGLPVFGYPAKDQAKAGGRVCRGMSMLVLDKLHYGKLVPAHM
jgi:hypothetical protein